MSLSIKSRHYLPTTVCNHPPPPAPGQSGSAVALASLLLPRSPAPCGHLCAGPGSGEMRAPCLLGKHR